MGMIKPLKLNKIFLNKINKTSKKIRLISLIDSSIFKKGWECNFTLALPLLPPLVGNRVKIISI